MRHAASFAATEIPFNYGPSYVPPRTGGAPVDDPSAAAGVVIGAGASVVVDPQASINLVSGRSLDILGSIIDHGGAITLAGALDTWIGSAP